jgi:hypothetical protein
MGKKEKDLSFVLIIMKAEMWIDIVLLQINRLLMVKVLLKDLDMSKKLSENNWNINTQRIADEHFLRVGLLKSKEWINELAKITEEGSKLQKEIEKYSSISDLRNMSEHELDYYKGIGHSQKKFVNRNNGLNALQTGIIDDDYLIGGRLSLNEINKSFKYLKSEISKKNFTIKIDYVRELQKYI